MFALGANLAIAVAKLGGAVATGSSAMHAEFPDIQWLCFEPDVKD